MTTPNEAVTSMGVWPISSVRNVMVKVKDTATFIAAARAVHGDKYDYSQTAYNGSRKPIVIVCKNCGKVQLSEAQSHYQIGRECGCRRCEQEEMLVRKGQAHCCDMCGERVKYTGGWHRCKDCRESLNSEWCVALGLAEQRLKIRCKVNTLDGWNRWAKNKGSILSNRHIIRGTGFDYRLKPRIASWSNWELSVAKSLVSRKVECKWTRKLRNWARSLTCRERRQDENN